MNLEKIYSIDNLKDFSLINQILKNFTEKLYLNIQNYEYYEDELSKSKINQFVQDI